MVEFLFNKKYNDTQFMITSNTIECVVVTIEDLKRECATRPDEELSAFITKCRTGDLISRCVGQENEYRCTMLYNHRTSDTLIESISNSLRG